MAKFIIKGEQKLSGEIKVSGAKNQALKIIPAAILSQDKITIKNLPNIEDVNLALELIEAMGGEVIRSDHQAEIKTDKINKIELPEVLVNKFRASIMFVGPTLIRLGEVKFPHPGGCVIGANGRPIDLFLEGFEALGAEVTSTENHYHIKAKKMHGADFFFAIMSVTGTESLMMTATLIPGTTTLRNCAMEPEIKELAAYLNSQGAKISGAGTPTITIEGVERLSAGEFKVIPDRIEAGSFALLAAATKSNIKITNCDPRRISILLSIFKKIGIDFEAGSDFLEIRAAKKIKPYSIKTHEYPGFPTDLQAPYTVLMTQAEGASTIHETIYDRRLVWTDMLSQMGANIIMCDPHRVVVNGPTPLYGHRLTSPDLRAGIALIIAALIAQGQTSIDNIYQIDRGYEKLDIRLQALGADIKRID